MAAHIKAVVLASHAAITLHIDELTALDAAIGDGDHGVNMKRGMDAILGDVDSLAALPLSDALVAAATRLVMTIGGASGPLFGTFLASFGQALGSSARQEQVSAAFGLAVAAVAKRGKSQVGEKTMLDVLVPISNAIALQYDCLQLAEIARNAAHATIPVRATKGRAAYLGVRSIGHMDPGARSVSLLMDAVASVVGQK